MELIYYGHACFLLRLGTGRQLLFDPFMSPNPLAHVDISTLKPDYVLLSHGHEDHVADVIPIVRQSDALLVAAYEVAHYFERRGLQKIHPMNQGGTAEFEGFSLKCTPAHHSSSMPDGSYGGPAMGFVVSQQKQHLYYSGDTALSYDMKLIGEAFALDIAVLPIGDTFTMGVQDAIRAAQFVGCRRVLGVHYDTFPAIEIDKKAAQAAFRKAGLELLLLDIGQTVGI